MRVLKFGGSSAGNPESVKNIIEIILKHKAKNDGLIVVFSAFKGMTDKLIEMGKMAANGDMTYSILVEEFNNIHYKMVVELIPVRRQSSVTSKVMSTIRELSDTLQGVSLVKELTPKSLDTIMSFGERLSAMIIFEAVKKREPEAELLDTREIIICNDNFGSGKVNFPETNCLISEYFSRERGKVQIATGFIASTAKGEIITLGRGGSDYTASVLGAALNAEVIEIWKDVCGVMSADPKRVPDAFPVPSLSYEEAAEISHLGAKVIYPPTMHPATEKKIPLRIMNTLDPSFEGTLISAEYFNPKSVKGVTAIEEISILVLKGSGSEGISEIAKRFFSALYREKIEFFLFSHCSSEQSISVAVTPSFVKRAQKCIQEEFRYELVTSTIEEITIKENLSIVSVVGSGIRYAASSTAKLSKSLEKTDIEILSIAKGSSELNISAVIPAKDLTRALNSIHESFFDNGSKNVNIFIAGTGLIGKALLSQIERQRNYLREKECIKLNVKGLCNSNKMLVAAHPVDLQKWNNTLEEKGEKSDKDIYIKNIIELKAENSVFVDCTASEEFTTKYKELLSAGVSVATPNKRANSGSYKDYEELRSAARANKASFFYEANVCAGLPVLRTIKELVLSGDTITKIEGILSGSLSYIFNTYDTTRKFADIVREAAEKGYTEPDPREDLSGTDVVRKLTILVRECGYKLDASHVGIFRPLPGSVKQGSSVEEFYENLAKNENWFKDLKEKADKEGKALRFVASYQDGKASASLQMVGREHPFYHICQSDNVVAIHSRYYNSTPLVIRGPGAGAEVTAAAVFADIIRVGH